MNKIIRGIQSYIRAIYISEMVQRLPAVLIALWLGVISIAMIPQMNIVEGGILFILFFISCLLIDSALNPKKIKDPKIARSLRIIGMKNYIILIMVHVIITLSLAAHLSYILEKPQIIVVIIMGLSINSITSISLSRSRSLVRIPNVTGVIGGVILPMIGAFYIVADNFDMFSMAILGGVGFIYMGLEIFNQARADLEVAPEAAQDNSIEWEAMSVAAELNLPKSRVKEIVVHLYNIHNEEAFKKIPADKCILFLPHCLRNAERCKATYNDEGLQCKHCQKDCKINILTREAEKLNYKCFVVPGGAMVFNIAKKYEPKGVVAVACLNELREGTALTETEYKAPFQIIQLSRDGCVNTDVPVDDVMETLSSNTNSLTENN